MHGTHRSARKCGGEAVRRSHALQIEVSPMIVQERDCDHVRCVGEARLHEPCHIAPAIVIRVREVGVVQRFVERLPEGMLAEADRLVREKDGRGPGA